MSDTALNKIIQYGTSAERAAFTPDPAPGSQVLYIWYDSDNSPDTYVWDGSAWVLINDTTAAGITELTGDVTAGPGSGSQAAAIAALAVTTAKINAKAVTYAKIQDVSVTARLLGRATAGAGVIEEITLGTNLALAGSTLNASGGGADPNLTYLTEADESGDLPNSRALLAGTNITFDDSVPNERTINAAGGGGGAGWTFIATAAASGTAVDFIGLASYNEILVILKNVTATGACIRQLLVSDDNGSTFKNTSGNYISIDSNGAESNASVLSFDNGNNGSAHSGWIQISLFDDTNSPIKPANASFPTTNTVQAVNLNLALSAIRVRPHANAFNGGNIYVFAR